MKTRTNVAVLDIGKTNAKVVVFDIERGIEVAHSQIQNIVLSGPPYPHYDTEMLWSFFIQSLKSFAREPGYDAISITAHGASAALLDERGNLALPVLDYEFEFPEDIVETYAAIRPPFHETFSPLLPAGLNLGAQLHFQKSTLPREFARVRTILMYPQYWAFRLSGVLANEVTSLGCHTDLWLPEQKSYSKLVDRLGIRSLMAPIFSAFDELGPVKKSIAEDLDLTRAVPVFLRYT